MNALTGTGELIRLALHRDRVMLPVWIAVFVIPAAAGINAIPSLVALYGRVYDPTSLGALAMLKMGVFGAALVAVLAMFTVIRHTRAEEETGRLELIGAAVVGRYAALTAALIVTVSANLLLGLLTALGLVAVRLPAAGAVAFGLSWAMVGIGFAAVAAVVAQLTRGARAAKGISVAVLGLAYLLRAIGDASGNDATWGLSWLSPLGWGQQVRPFAGNRWWVLLILIVFAIVLVSGAYSLSSRRDMGAGLLAGRPGPARAAAGLRSPLALAWRLQRGVLLFGLAPRLVIAGWVALVAFLLLVELGPLLQLDPRVMDISPFTHVPKLPGGELTMTPLVLLTAIAVALITIGLAGFRRRDVG